MFVIKLFLFWITVTFCGVMTELNQDKEHFTFSFYLLVSLKERYLAKSLFHNWENTHGYIPVRREVHIFYWLFYADGTKLNATNKPFVIWIQGGPGLAASGVGNFAEIGPLNMNMQPRNHTWVNGRNVLFIDHPIGTGFSYVTNSSLYVKTDRDLAMDLSKVIKAFYRKHKEFRKTPTYLFGQSYGGKICPRLAYYLHTAIEKKSLKMNLKGIGIGSGWVNPKESTATLAQFLYFSGAIDRKLYVASSKLAKELVKSIEAENTFTAQAFETLLLTLNDDQYINFNNVYAESPYIALDRLRFKINEYIKPMLTGVNQVRYWEYMSFDAYDNLKENFFLPSTSFLEAILNQTKLKVAIYNGNLDVVTPLPGAVNWVHKLRWHGAHEFEKAHRKPIPGKGNGFYKIMKNLSFWWVFGAGHWVPEENPEAMEEILRYVMTDD